MDATTIAVDLAKHVFELATTDRSGRVLERRRLNRAQFARFLIGHPPTHVVMEACATAHHWGRVAQDAGHRVSLLPPQYVRPFVRRQKTDRTDVAGLLDAQRSDHLHPVPVKTVGQQEVLALHRVRQQWIATRTARINALHGLLGEYGVCVRPTVRRIGPVVGAVLADAEAPLPGRLRRALQALLEEIAALTARITGLDHELKDLAADDATMTRLQTIPGVGVLTATAMVGAVAHIHAFRRARRFASWLGVTPREHSSGNRRRLGGITKQGDTYLRTLLTQGARAVLFGARRAVLGGRALPALQAWAVSLAERRGVHRAVMALANRLARIVWAVWSRDVAFAPRTQAA
jgi:transposase